MTGGQHREQTVPQAGRRVPGGGREHAGALGDPQLGPAGAGRVEDLGAGSFPHLFAELTPAVVRRADEGRT